MREILLIIHFIGLAMVLGTSFAYMFLGIASSKMEKSEATKFTINTFALSKMGHIGLALLIISGLLLMTPYWESLFSMPLLIVKLVFVLILSLVVSKIASTAKKAKQGNPEAHFKKIIPLGRASMFSALTIVVLAVLIFH